MAGLAVPDVSRDAYRLTGRRGLVHDQVQVVVLGAVRERADVRTAVEPGDHARQQRRGGDLLVGQTGVRERVAIDPFRARGDALMVITELASRVPDVVPREL